MESGSNCEVSTLLNELTQGMELAKQLKFHLNSTSSTETREMLVQKILSSYDKALLILNWNGSVEQAQPGGQAIVPLSPISVDGSPLSDDSDKGFKQDVSKKRKMLPRWTDQVRVSSENWLEGPHDDIYSWRKYGQKDILGAKYPRSYYRCTYRKIRGCEATKQVQRSDEDPSIFDITFRGTHTCMPDTHSGPAIASPEKQKQKLKQNNHHDNQKQNQSKEILESFQTNLRVNTENLDNKEVESFLYPSPSFGFMSESHASPSMFDNDNQFGNFFQSFISPASSESNYFSVSPCQMNSFGGVPVMQHSESDLTEIISANTSTTNSPILDLDFPLDPVDLDPNFPFDNPNFFP
uniref:WRKY protein n=1 Tax=Paeonia lactiflora TaxID=35924 RepID=A0A3R5WE40_PAELC|nr:WRKY protein [Paeonia lactiflora]WAX53433.1 WRKY transcription factor [Paeonia lactiflora]